MKLYIKASIKYKRNYNFNGSCGFCVKNWVNIKINIKGF